MEDSSTLLYICYAVDIALVLLALVYYLRSPDVSHIETLGSPGLLGPYWTAIQFLVNGPKVLQEGYDRYKPRPFKVLTLRGWLVMLNRVHLEDIANASEADLSFFESFNDILKVQHTMGSDVYHDPYHISIIQTQLKRNLPTLCPDIEDEMVNAFNDYLPVRGNEWTAVPAYDTFRKIVARSTNRMLVGLPLCRDPGWVDFTVELSAAVAKEAAILRILPSFIVPLVSKYVTGLRKRTKKGTAYLGPVIAERLMHMHKYAEKEWTDKPNDFLQWCLSAGKETSVVTLTRRLLALNFASNHTTSNTVTQALYHLAVNPKLVLLLREEVETVVEKYGWTREAVAKMRRVDSFLKETLRYEGVAWVTIERTAVKDVMLSDGTLIPKGIVIEVASNGIHRDPSVYKNGDVFEPFRFADIESDEEGYKHQIVSVNSASLSFGYGKTACPGRFLAAVLLKMMIARIVLHFDVKLDENSPPPKSLVFGVAILADPTARVLLRKRSN